MRYIEQKCREELDVRRTCLESAQDNAKFLITYNRNLLVRFLVVCYR